MIKTELDTLESGWKSPSKTRSKDTGFESAVPQDRTRRSGKIAKTGEIDSLLPHSAGLGDLFFLKKSSYQREEIVFQPQLGMQGGEPIPDLESIRGVGLAGLVDDGEQVSVAHRRKDAVHDPFDAGVGPQRARQRFGAASGFGFHGTAHLEERGVRLALAEEKISVAPGNVSRERISFLCVKESVASRRDIPRSFLGCAQVAPYLGRPRIQRQRNAIGPDSAGGVRVLQIVLPIAAQQMPILEVAGFQPCGPLIALKRPEARIVSGKRVSNAQVRKQECANKRKSGRETARLEAGGKLTHSPVLCLDRAAVARKNSDCRFVMVRTGRFGCDEVCQCIPRVKIEKDCGGAKP